MLLIDTNIFLEVMLGQIKRKACIEFLTAVRAERHKAAVTDFNLFDHDYSGRLWEASIARPIPSQPICLQRSHGLVNIA